MICLAADNHLLDPDNNSKHNTKSVHLEIKIVKPYFKYRVSYNTHTLCLLSSICNFKKN